MKKTWSLLILLPLFAFDATAAVNQNSDAYQTGSLAGKIFVAVLLFLIVKKLFFKKNG
ncbi:MAG: hypothetical protein OEW69_12015 [Nitrospirota bacterium]|nr:hypothetical protein [Nitrospirota bacterium]MDH5630222.1 hypothetical protein [Gammaproteobacteria bacterium]